MRTRPEVGRRMPASDRSVVVLPAPFGPMRPTISPGPTSNDRSSTATKSTKTRLRCSTEIAMQGGVLDLAVPEVIDYVAQHASALKAHRQSLKNRERNRQYRSRLRSALKSIRTAIDGKDLAAARSALKQTISLIDKRSEERRVGKECRSRRRA